MNPNKPVFLHYNIVDCEHEGDVESAENEVERIISPIGGKVTDSYWDGDDCGEAWVECKIPYNIDNINKLINSGDFCNPYQY